jgi:hypothetical protein
VRHKCDTKKSLWCSVAMYVAERALIYNSFRRA